MLPAWLTQAGVPLEPGSSHSRAAPPHPYSTPRVPKECAAGSPQGKCTVRPGVAPVSTMSGKAPRSGVIHPPVSLARDTARKRTGLRGM